MEATVIGRQEGLGGEVVKAEQGKGLVRMDVRGNTTAGQDLKDGALCYVP
jgi:hypothetical protein